MKVLHFIIDGYHPSNKTVLFDYSDLYGNIKEYYDAKVLTTKTDGSQHLRSPFMWFRYYSRRYLHKLEDDNRQITSLFDDVNGEELIWRKLAKKGVASFVSPYNDLTSKPTKWLVGLDESKELVNGLFKKWYSKDRWDLEEGKFTKTKTNDIMSAFMAAIKTDCKLSGDILEKLDYMNSSEDGDTLVKRFIEIEDELAVNCSRVIFPKLQGNYTEYCHILNRLMYFITRYYSKSQYIHLGLGESDALYHHHVYNTNLIDTYRQSITRYICSAIDIVDPDVIIISGDHNMISLDKCREYEKSYTNPSKNRRPAGYVTLNKPGGGEETYTLSKSMNHPLPIFHEHGYDVGGVLMYKNDLGEQFVNRMSSKIDENKIYSPEDDLFPEFLYDTLLEMM